MALRGRFFSAAFEIMSSSDAFLLRRYLIIDSIDPGVVKKVLLVIDWALILVLTSSTSRLGIVVNWSSYMSVKISAFSLTENVKPLGPMIG